MVNTFIYHLTIGLAVDANKTGVSETQRYEAKMKNLTGSELVSEFIRHLRDNPNYRVKNTTISRNVFNLAWGNSEVFIYVMGRSGEPHQWGVTKD